MRWEEDFVMRAVERLAEFLARALKLTSAGQLDEARTLLDEASGAAMGIELDALLFMDGASARMVLREPERVVSAARLLEAAGLVEARAGDLRRALTFWLKAIEFLETVQTTQAQELSAQLAARCRELA